MPRLRHCLGRTHHRKQVAVTRVFAPLLAGDLTLPPFGNSRDDRQRRTGKSGIHPVHFIHLSAVLRFQQSILPERTFHSKPIAHLPGSPCPDAGVPPFRHSLQ